jgi:transcriptional regulator with XRE-family HTH domain
MLTPRSKQVLAIEARRALDLSREEFGNLLHWSKRTVARWEGGQSDLDAADLVELARHVYPRDAALAEEIALAGGATLERLGIVPPPALPAPQPPFPGNVLVDSVLCAAADALKAVPETVRAAVLASFRRARELRMTVEDVEKALTKR